MFDLFPTPADQLSIGGNIGSLLNSLSNGYIDTDLNLLTLRIPSNATLDLHWADPSHMSSGLPADTSQLVLRDDETKKRLKWLITNDGGISKLTTDITAGLKNLYSQTMYGSMLEDLVFPVLTIEESNSWLFQGGSFTDVVARVSITNKNDPAGETAFAQSYGAVISLEYIFKHINERYLEVGISDSNTPFEEPNSSVESWARFYRAKKNNIQSTTAVVGDIYYSCIDLKLKFQTTLHLRDEMSPIAGSAVDSVAIVSDMELKTILQNKFAELGLSITAFNEHLCELSKRWAIGQNLKPEASDSLLKSISMIPSDQVYRMQGIEYPDAAIRIVTYMNDVPTSDLQDTIFSLTLAHNLDFAWQLKTNPNIWNI